MVPGIGIGRARYASYTESTDTSGWNGWLYPLLFIVLPIIAGLMILALILCNLYEYYQKKRRLEQYQHYSGDFPAPVFTEPEKRVESDKEMAPEDYKYNDSQFTYSTIFGNYAPNEANKIPVRPLSGWVAPNM